MKIVISRRVYKELNKLSDSVRRLVVTKIKALAIAEKNLNIRKLSNCEGYRLRVGDYRVIYKVTVGELIILSVAHRKDAYRK